MGWRGELASPWKDALALSSVLPHAAVQWHLPAVSLTMCGQLFSLCLADWPGGWQTQDHAGGKASWWEGTEAERLGESWF